jgi:hypothetical protein
MGYGEHKGDGRQASAQEPKLISAHPDEYAGIHSSACLSIVT